jgi:hypothetical protein
MQQKLAIALLASIILSSTSGAALADTVLAPFKREAVSVTLKPGWSLAKQLGAGELGKGINLLQFLPAGSDPKDARVLVNIVTYLGAPGNAKSYAERQQKSAPSSVKAGKIEFKILDDSNPNDVMYQIVVTGNPTFADQFEMHRVLTGKQGIHDVVYHVKPATPTSEQIAEMREVLGTVKLVDPPKDKPAK